MNIEEFKSILPGKWLFDYGNNEVKKREFNSESEIVIRHPDGKEFTSKAFFNDMNGMVGFSIPALMEVHCIVSSYTINQFLYKEYSHSAIKQVQATRILNE